MLDARNRRMVYGPGVFVGGAKGTFDFDTPQGLKPGGFSVLRRGFRYASPMGLPGPFYVLCGVMVPMQARATVRATMPADGKPLATRTPQPEHLWLVNAGSTAITFRPAHAALKERMLKNADQPASWIDLARWWFLTMLRTCKSS